MERLGLSPLTRTAETTDRVNRSGFTDQFGIIVADPHSVLRDCTQRILSAESGVRVLATIASGDKVVESVRHHRPDLLLLDSGMFGAMHLLQQVSIIADTAVILFAAKLWRDEALLAIRLGIRGIVGKDAPVETVVQCVRRECGLRDK